MAGVRGIGVWSVILAGLFLFLATASGHADPVSVQGADLGDRGRLTFQWEWPVNYSAEIRGKRLIVEFGRPIEASYGAAVRALGKYVTGATPGKGGRSVAFALTGDFELGYYDMGTSVIVDLVGKPPAAKVPKAEPAPAPGPVAAAETASAPSVPAATPKPVRSHEGTEHLPRLGVRTGVHADYTRIVFDWPRKVDYGVAEEPDATTVIFARGARPDLGAFQTDPPRFVKSADWEMKGKRLAVILETDRGVRVKHFNSGDKVVVDLLPPTPESIARAEAMSAERAAQAAQAEPGGMPEAEAGQEPASPAEKPAEAMAEAAKPDDGRPTQLTPSARQEAALPSQSEAAPPPPPMSAEPVIEKTLDGPVPEVSLRFDWDEPVAAAVFRRAGAVWVVFDKAVTLDSSILRQAAGETVHRVDQVPSDDGTVLRFMTVDGINPHLRRDGLAWILDLGGGESKPTQAIEAEAQPDSPIGARIFLAVPEPGKAIPVVDPEVGDSLVIVPVIPLGHGVEEIYVYPQVRILPSAQGIVIRPLIDTLRVRPLRQGVELTSIDQLAISAVTPQEAAGSKLAGTEELSRLFDLEKWRRGTVDTFNKFRRNFKQAAAEARDPQEQENRRLDLARFFFSSGFSAETLGVLQVVEDTRPEIKDEPAFIALKGASNFLLARYPEAQAIFAHQALDGNDEAAFWRAIVQAIQGDLAGASAELKRTSGIIQPYPKALKVPLGLLVAESAVEAGDVKHAEHTLEVIKLEDLNPREAAEFSYVEGRLLELSGDFDGAVASWEKGMDSDDRWARARAAVARAELLYKLEKISRAEIIEELEKLRFAWRGDDFEFNLLRRLGTLYLEEGGYREGLRTLRQAATHFRNHPDAARITQQMADTFADLYLEGAADSLPPVTAIALYDEFKELTPAGERGDEMIRKLADRLVSVDLLDRGAALLESQVNFRLRGVLQSRVGARLALVYLLDHKPDKALGALKVSDNPGQPDELKEQRLHLRVRALMQQEKFDEALELLKKDKSVDGEMLRADIYWQTKDWADAAQSIRRLTKLFGAKAGEPLDDRQARYILNLATALTLAGNDRSISRLRRDFGPAMDQTPFREAFRLIARPPAPDLIDYQSIAQRVAEAEKFQSFMSTYRQRLKDTGLSAMY